MVGCVSVRSSRLISAVHRAGADYWTTAIRLDRRTETHPTRRKSASPSKIQYFIKRKNTNQRDHSEQMDDIFFPLILHQLYPVMMWKSSFIVANLWKNTKTQNCHVPYVCSICISKIIDCDSTNMLSYMTPGGTELMFTSLQKFRPVNSLICRACGERESSVANVELIFIKPKLGNQSHLQSKKG